ncbi:MAG TPA: hypothetical protein VL970_06270 [Candidatus Acidoferrales bacterium]|nr:hypothetical protein [Candidatus Acidoferrales bacterium]
MREQTGKSAMTGKAIVWFFVELAVYALFVLAYYFAVLHFCRDWLKALFEQHKTSYAVVALGLIVGQAFVLELVTVVLYRLTRRPAK